MRKPALSIAALLIAGSLAACGGVDKNAYVDEVTGVQKTTQTEATALSTKMASAKTPKDVATNLKALAASVKENAVKLDAIEAPEDVATQHQDYVKLMNDFASEIDTLSAKVAKATPTTLPSVLTEAQAATTKLSTGEQKIVSEINSELQG